MSGLQIKVTDAGRAALVNAQNNGTAPVLVSEVGVTATAFTADASTAALPGEVKRLATISGVVVAADTIHVTINDSSADVYSVRGLALYLSDGTLFASYGQADVILEKSSLSTMLLAADVVFADIDATSLTFGDATFANPMATTEVVGVVELATAAEGIAGADGTRAMTPSANKAALDDRLGAGAPTPFVKSLLNLATAALFRASLAIKSAALFDSGAGNGLDADKLDGQEGAYYLDYNNATNKPADAIPLSQKGIANGVATLGADAKMPKAQLPALVQADIANLVADLAAKAPLLSPALTGTPTAPTAAAGTNTTQLATTAFVTAAVAPKAPLASPAFTGAPTAPTPAAADDSTHLATTAWVRDFVAAQLAGYLPKANPTFTGTMTGPAFNKAP